jgi:hypothetical protein
MKNTKLIFTSLLLTSLLQSHAFAFGTIAVGDADSKAKDASTEQHVIVSGQDSPEAARSAALKQCADKGLSYCRAAVWFETCGAYAKSEKNSGTGSGSTQDEAEQNSLASCGKDCKVVVSRCEGGKSL